MCRRFIAVCVLTVALSVSVVSQDRHSDSDSKTIIRHSEYLGNIPDTAIWVSSIHELTDSIVPSIVPIESKYFKCSYPGIWRIDTIGTWNKKVVIDCYYEVKCLNMLDTTIEFSQIVAKAIAVEISTQNIQVLYISSTEPWNTSFTRTKLIQVKGYEILLTRSQMSGTSHVFDEAYWVWSDLFDGPIELKLNDIDRDRKELKSFLPPKHGIWKGGLFDILTLSFQSYTWRDGDGNCCPTGGKYTVEYGIENDSLVIMKAMFDYSDLEERALWQAKHSADSMYMKNPPIIYERD